jgi:hypothetical protein
MLYRGSRVAHRMSRQKSKSQPKILWKLDALIFCASAEKILRQRGKQACAIATGPIRVHTTAMRKPLQRGQSILNNVVVCGTTQARYKTSATGVVVGMSPIRMPPILPRARARRDE